MKPVINDLRSADKEAWLALWLGYLQFYETELTPEVTQNTWARLLDPDGGIKGLVAVDATGAMIGFVHYLLHPGTWDAAPICYLEDLYVASKARGTGAGRALIEALAAKGRLEKWQHIYWQTAAGNSQARALYDKLATSTDWVRYDLKL